ncbi:MAG TPA: hypothetical protein VKR06_24340 [Ktedonosporobacter sp.]|nr:hypothetical protein [Ktedonosporobacter sp.]
MRRSRLPAVRGDRLFWPDDAENQLAPVMVGTDAWYDWLVSAPVSSFSFQGQHNQGERAAITCPSSLQLLSGASR